MENGVAPAAKRTALGISARPESALADFGLAQTSVSVADRARRGLRVELVRVVQHSRLGRARGGPVVVRGDGVQELGENGGGEIAGALFDQP